MILKHSSLNELKKGGEGENPLPSRSCEEIDKQVKENFRKGDFLEFR